MTDTNNTTVQTSALDALVGPGKKFADPEALAKAKLDADNFVEKLKGETKDLRAELTTAVEELTKLKSKVSILDRLNGNPNKLENEEHPKVEPKSEPQTKGLSEEDVLRVVEQAEVNKASRANQTEVDGVLTRLFGNEAGAYLLQKAGELGVPPTDLKALALKSPKAFYNLLGIDPSVNPSNSTYTGTGRVTTIGTQEPIRNKAFYDKKKSEMGSRAYVLDRELQIQLHKDMETLGEAFFQSA